jgi:hypothetical protein
MIMIINNNKKPVLIIPCTWGAAAASTMVLKVSLDKASVSNDRMLRLEKMACNVFIEFLISKSVISLSK